MMVTMEREIAVAADRIYDSWSKGSLRDPFTLIQKALRQGVDIGSLQSRRLSQLGLTKQQHNLLVFIAGYSEKHGYPPSFDEMRDELGLKSKSGIHRLVTALEERGRIIRLPNRARAISLPERSA